MNPGFLKLNLLILFFSFLYPGISVAPAGQGSPSDYPVSKFLPFSGSLPYPGQESYNAEFTFKTDSVVIPLKRAGRLFLIEAKVDGEEGNLVFDTGADKLVINSTYFRNHVVTGGAKTSGITGSMGQVSQMALRQIEFAGLAYKNLRADVSNLGHIENRRGVKILGLVGFGIFRNFEIVFDAKNSELRLYRIDKSGNRTGSHPSKFEPDHAQEISGSTNILFLKGSIGGKVMNFCFDTGAETNAVSSFSNKKIMGTITITRRTVLKGAGAAGSEVLFGRMNEFLIGTQQIQGMETIITNLSALNEAYATTIDGMLGYSFMERGVVCINFVKKQFGIRFWKGGEV